jgi:hypothetical protein
MELAGVVGQLAVDVSPYRDASPSHFEETAHIGHKNSIYICIIYIYIYIYIYNAGHTQRHGAISEVKKEFISRLTRSQLTLTTAGGVQVYVCAQPTYA